MFKLTTDFMFADWKDALKEYMKEMKQVGAWDGRRQVNKQKTHVSRISQWP